MGAEPIAKRPDSGRERPMEAEHVERAVREGWSLRQVADVLGVSRQAVQKKHAKRLRANGVDLRREKC